MREHNLPVLGSYLYKYLNGYATDSNYSETLIKIIEINNFKELENVEIKFVDSNPELINLTWLIIDIQTSTTHFEISQYNLFFFDLSQKYTDHQKK